MVVLSLDNLNVNLMELVDLVKSMPIALLLFLTVELMEAVTIAEVLEKDVDLKMVVKSPTNKIAIAETVSAPTSVPAMLTALNLNALLIVTLIRVAVSNVTPTLNVLIATGPVLRL
jgi:hypothetical protein